MHLERSNVTTVSTVITKCTSIAQMKDDNSNDSDAGHDDDDNDDDDYRRLGVETERSGVPHRESKPSAHRHRTARIARTTRQINGAMDFCG